MTGSSAVVGRAFVGGLLGVLIGRVIVRELGDRTDDAWWPSWAAGAALAVAFAAAPSVVGLTRQRTVAALAMITAGGLYLGVPETDHILGLLVGLAVLAIAEVRGRVRSDTIIVMAIDAALVWAAIRGAANREGAVVGGLALLGLLLVAPLVIGGSSRRANPPLAAAMLVIAQLVFVVVVARNGALRPDASGAALVACAGLVGLAGTSRLIVTGRLW